MRFNAEERLRQVAQIIDDNSTCNLSGEKATINAAAGLAGAAENLLEDIRRRHPGEDFTCPFIIALDEALQIVEIV